MIDLANLGRTVGALPRRLAGWAFDRRYVHQGRYGCFNQQPYLDQHPTSLVRSTGFDWTLYQTMLSDHARIAAYRRDIEAHVDGASVLEVGPGPTAVLTRIALAGGAERVVSVEGNAWVAESARRHLRRSGVPHERATVVTKLSDDLDVSDTGGQRHFDVLVLEVYHAIAAQERVVETVEALRRNGFSFDSVISRGFVTRVAPARGPRPRAMTRAERVVLGWPGDPGRAGRAMATRPSSLHGDPGPIESLHLAPAQVWQSCDLESGEPAHTAGILSFEVDDLGAYDGLLFSNDLHFHDGEVLDTLQTPTSWGAFFVPLPLIGPVPPAGPLLIDTTLPVPDSPSTVEVRASSAGAESRWLHL